MMNFFSCVLRPLAIVMVAMSAVGIPAARVYCQAVFVTAAPTTTDPNDQKQPFLLPSLSKEMIEGLDEYKRFCARSQWEKAFKHLEKLANTKETGLAPGKDGAMIPVAALLRQLISELPNDGKKAYRLFYDAEAKTLLEAAKGKDEQPKLAAIVSKYLFTSTGDIAADRLGDLYFEQGKFSLAAQTWQLIVKFRSDSAIPVPQLLVKTAIALAHDGRWTDLEEVQKLVRDRYPSETAKLGGKSVRAVEHLEMLSGKRQQGRKTNEAETPLPARIHLEDDAKPLWQFKWYVKKEDQPDGQRMQSFVAPTVADGAHVFANFIGYDVDIDLATGKLLWRSGRFFDGVQKARNNGNMMVADKYGIAVGPDRVWSVSRPLGSNDPFQLTARERKTGKEVLNGKNVKGLKEWNLLGSPVVEGSFVYVTGVKPNKARELHVLALSADKAEIIWDATVGSYKNEMQERNPYGYSEQSVLPSLLLRQNWLYVNTNMGTILRLDPGSGETQWGLYYESQPPTDNNNGWYYERLPDQWTASPPMMVDGTLYFKGMRSKNCYAVDPEGPRVVWKRPITKTAVLCGIDDKNIYFGGEDISACDRKSLEMQWSKQVPMGMSWVRPLVTEDCIYQFTPRGIYEIPKDGGAVRIFRGSDLNSLGGGLLLTPSSLVSFSNLAITAYPINSAAANDGNSEDLNKKVAQ
jgi:outer membrane protein assembly factor BamB